MPAGIIDGNEIFLKRSAAVMEAVAADVARWSQMKCCDVLIDGAVLTRSAKELLRFLAVSVSLC